MIDIDTTEIKMLPMSHIALQSYDGIMELKRKNNVLKSVVFIIASVGLLIITFNILTSGQSNKPKTGQNKES